MEKISDDKKIFTDQITQRRVERILNRIEDMLHYITNQLDGLNHDYDDHKNKVQH